MGCLAVSHDSSIPRHRRPCGRRERSHGPAAFGVPGSCKDGSIDIGCIVFKLMLRERWSAVRLDDGSVDKKGCMLFPGKWQQELLGRHYQKQTCEQPQHVPPAVPTPHQRGRLRTQCAKSPLLSSKLQPTGPKLEDLKSTEACAETATGLLCHRQVSSVKVRPRPWQVPRGLSCGATLALSSAMHRHVHCDSRTRC